MKKPVYVYNIINVPQSLTSCSKCFSVVERENEETSRSMTILHATLALTLFCVL